MVVLYSQGEKCESNHWRGISEECHKGRTSGKLWKPGHAVANFGLDVAIHSSAYRSSHISHIIIFPPAKTFAAGNVNSVWSVITVLGILPIAILYFMRSAWALLTVTTLLTGPFTFLIKWRFISMGWLHNITSWSRSQIGSWLIKVIKHLTVFILIGTINFESDKEYDSTFVFDPSRSVNCCPL